MVGQSLGGSGSQHRSQVSVTAEAKAEAEEFLCLNPCGEIKIVKMREQKDGDEYWYFWR
jgi:hypothetical protein